MLSMGKIINRCLVLGVAFFMFGQRVQAQQTLTQIDSSLFIKDTLKPILKRYENLRISGYMQTQYQVAQSDGAKSFAGGDFQPDSHNRFMMRRGRIKFEYLLMSKENLPKLYFAFQFDGTERGVNIRDFWGKYYENKYNVLALTTGVFARPFGYEVNWSSMVREAPERGRMSQILLQTERDLGMMLTFEPQKNGHKLRFLRVDAGLFNGQGLPGRADFDSHKDFIGRVSFRPLKLQKNVNLTGSVSYYHGSTQQYSKYVWEHGKVNGKKGMTVDSSMTNIGKYSRRQYYSGDAQLKIKGSLGLTELRGEYWQGIQPGSRITSQSFPSKVEASLPRYIRNFNGAFFYFLQNIGTSKHQVVAKYDWYDPNTDVKGDEITEAGNYTEADIRYNTLGLGYVYYFNDHFKFTLWYDNVRNEHTQLPEYMKDVKDDVLTLRVQYKF